MKETICLVGKSGSGKTTIANELKKLGFKVLDSYTTRPPRHENEEGHIFASKDEFNSVRGDFVAYTLFSGHEYGATRKQFEESDIYVIDPAGIGELIENVGRENLIIVYVSALDGIRFHRMKEERSPAEAFKRISHDEVAFLGFDEFDIALENNFPDDLKRNVKNLEHIINIRKVHSID